MRKYLLVSLLVALVVSFSWNVANSAVWQLPDPENVSAHLASWQLPDPESATFKI
ncbi:hypothetical protein [Tumebacillus permanentifrigoris]|uniref:hypothetical protein n=1 Tax=Tumebacillus permanentifrigoris TaxID=378543 RepID=UPI001473EC39|nr:hypothetical protein [Tumebacillus permanentifrigoris]